MSDDRLKELQEQLKNLDESNPNFDDLKEMLEDDIRRLTDSGMAKGGVVPTMKMTRRKFNMGGSVTMRARDNRADRESRGMVSRGGGAATQGIKFRGVK
tara:strand:+ start:4909 stop:5205 length:297 start_codon:yes stop_codon:yes gene_type:complete